MEIYSGTYLENNGLVVFHVTSKTTKIGGGVRYTSSETIPTDSRYACRCAIDPAGFLVIDSRESSYNDDLGIRWVSHAR